MDADSLYLKPFYYTKHITVCPYICFHYKLVVLA
uniref:Uncharacterized protein n=1 Tax=Staphylococcus phage 184DA TaxID=3110532 RepID=A0AAU6MXK9_9CAUD